MINKKNKRCLTGICVFYNANPILPQPPPPPPPPTKKKKTKKKKKNINLQIVYLVAKSGTISEL